tara:strand:+ start:24433 stop:25122 length:690 start_codon:yes stop_codon:yes gene_type:complete
MSKEVLIPKKWVWDGVCTYSTRYEFLSKYFIKQPATAGTAGQVLALNSDLEPVWTDEGELPAPGTEGQVLALNSSLEPVWQDDATSTTFKNTDIDASVGSYKGDVYETTTSSVLSLGTPAYVSGFSDTSSAVALSDITSLTQMNRMMGIVVASPAGATGNTLLIKGLVRVSAVGLFIGAPVYFVNGGFSATAPSTTGQYVRIAGYCVAAPFVGDPIIYFNPSQDFILLS